MNNRRMNNRTRIVTPEGQPAMQAMYSDEEILMMKHQGLSQMWANYAELVRKSDKENKEEIAAAANTEAADLLRFVIEKAEKQLIEDKKKGEKDASKRG